MMSNKYLFHLNTYNDVDHITPVTYKFLGKGDTVDVVFLSDFDYENDYRINFLAQYERFSATRASQLDHFRNKIFFNRLTRKMQNNPVFGNVMKIALNMLWPNKYLSRTVASIYEYGGPGRLNFYEAKMRNIPTICLPHGFNIFLNYDINEHVKEIKQKTGRWPDFSSRNMFEVYVLPTKRQRQWSIDWGQDSISTFAWGSARFFPDWSRINLGLLENFESKCDGSAKLKVVFFVPHWSYNVNEQATISMLTEVANDSETCLVIKGHTRGTGFLSQIAFRALKDKPNVILDTKAHSPALVEWCDVVINFGSSIAIEALNQRKPIIHPVFLHTNRTVFDDGAVVHIANDSEKVLLLINQAKVGGLSLPEEDNLKEFMMREIYCDGKNVDGLDRYYWSIQEINGSNSKNGMMPID